MIPKVLESMHNTNKHGKKNHFPFYKNQQVEGQNVKAVLKKHPWYITLYNSS